MTKDESPVQGGARDCPREEFGELLRYTVGGFAAGLVLGAVLDKVGLQRSGFGQWGVRTLCGEGESIFEGIYALRRRLAAKAASMAEAYGWGKLIGVIVPWIIDGFSRVAGLDVYGVGGFYIPFFYAMSDQIGANVAGLVYLRRTSPSRMASMHRYLRNPVMIASLAVILMVPVGLLAARLLGFSPTTQVYTSVELIAANLCWIPPLVGWLSARRAG